MPTIEETIKSRVSAHSYDEHRALSDAQVVELVELATHAPSAFNVQNWRFVAVRSPEAKARLLPLAFGQQKVVEAAVTFIVCGALKPHEALPAALEPTMQAGLIDEATFNAWTEAAIGMYQNDPQFQRDEAIRSGALAAMTLMLAAVGRGLVSTPMIGFDQSAVATEFGLATTEIPVMLLTVGYPGTENWPRKPRKPASEVIEFA